MKITKEIARFLIFWAGVMALADNLFVTLAMIAEGEYNVQFIIVCIVIIISFVVLLLPDKKKVPEENPPFCPPRKELTHFSKPEESDEP